MQRFLGIDLGGETIKLAELVQNHGVLSFSRKWLVEHRKDPTVALRLLLNEIDWNSLDGVACTGRLGRLLAIERVPLKTAIASGFSQLYSDLKNATVVSIGSHGFAVLEIRSSEHQILRENSRCSQGTGNFLRQLVERFNLTVQQASELCESVTSPAALSGRCPVILKTDMTHLANRGESRSKILAGL
ncbi:MAG: BadF/BadG/BcrA/BcrD ATPase family protein, partial [Pseudomonadota bacterium]